MEEVLFAGRRDLFTELPLTFFDTTSLYFEGKGGESLGQYGHSMDHRPDLHQMVMDAVLTGDGRPVCCEMWPGNQTDAQSLLPMVDRLRQRFGLRRVCRVADRGMISRDTIGALEDRNLEYILGARMRRQREVHYWTGMTAGQVNALSSVLFAAGFAVTAWRLRHGPAASLSPRLGE